MFSSPTVLKGGYMVPEDHVSTPFVGKGARVTCIAAVTKGNTKETTTGKQEEEQEEGDGVEEKEQEAASTGGKEQEEAGVGAQEQGKPPQEQVDAKEEDEAWMKACMDDRTFGYRKKAPPAGAVATASGQPPAAAGSGAFAGAGAVVPAACASRGASTHSSHATNSSSRASSSPERMRLPLSTQAGAQPAFFRMRCATDMPDSSS